MPETDMYEIPQPKESAVDAVVRRIRDLLMERKLKPGDLLPSEGELARRMGVSRGPLREAMKILTALGVVEIRRGNGTWVSESVGGKLLDPFLLRLVMSAPDRRQLVEFREMMEMDIARAALRNRDEAALEAAGAEIAHMENAAAGLPEPSGEALAEMDAAFHRALARATGNVLLVQLNEYILQFFEHSIRGTYRTGGNARSAAAYHQAILSALLAGDEAGALAAVKRSVQGWAEREEELP